MSNEPQQPRPDYRSGATGGEHASAPREPGSADARGAGEQGWTQHQGQQGYIPNQGAPRYSQPQGGQPQGEPRYAQNPGGQGRPQGDPRYAQNAGGAPYAPHQGYAQNPGGYQGDPRYAQQPSGDSTTVNTQIQPIRLSSHRDTLKLNAPAAAWRRNGLLSL